LFWRVFSDALLDTVAVSIGNKLLRYLRGDMNVAVRFPSDSQLLDSEVFQGPHIVAFSDASHAPLRTTGRRGISLNVLVSLVF